MSEFNYVETGNLSSEKITATEFEDGDQLDFNKQRSGIIAAAGIAAANTATSMHDHTPAFERPLTPEEQQIAAIATCGLHTKAMRDRYLLTV